jgi:predicted HTH domain antitoxin
MNARFEIAYPETLPDALNKTRKEFEREAKMAMAVKLFETGQISSGTAAGIAGISRVRFLLQLSDYGVPMIDLTKEELRSDLENA